MKSPEALKSKTVRGLLTIACLIFLISTIVWATTFSFTYDTATPAGSDDPAEADDRMREIKAAVQERLAVEHRFALTGTEVSDANTGEHTDITTDSIVNAGTLTNTGTITAVGAIIVGTTLDVNGNIDPTSYETTNGGFLDEDDMASDANDKVASQQSIKKYVDDSTNWTPASYAGEESVTYPNGLIVKSGYIAKSATITTLTFGTPFPAALVSIVVSAKRDANATDFDPVVWSESVTGCQFRTTAPVAGYYWEARGY